MPPAKRDEKKVRLNTVKAVLLRDGGWTDVDPGTLEYVDLVLYIGDAFKGGGLAGYRFETPNGDVVYTAIDGIIAYRFKKGQEEDPAVPSVEKENK